MPKPLILRRFWGLPPVDNAVEKWGQHVEKPMFWLQAAAFWPPAQGCAAAGVVFGGRILAIIRAKTRPKWVIHFIPIPSIHQKWMKKPRKTWVFQNFALFIHKVIHQIQKLSTGFGIAGFCEKMRKISH